MVVLTPDMKNRMKNFGYLHLLLASVCLILLFWSQQVGRTDGILLFLLLASINIVSLGIITVLRRKDFLFE